ncbi:MAG: RNA polymerase sporulation sigma factor SigE [Clostridia bacterium]|jgi:RNA polymerase sporulation-specific sigma factor|nr:RNA polymerase sporulation sigma factor SigE [Clostridia bacterium]
MNIIEILKDFYRKITKKDVEKLPVFYINGSQTLPPPLSADEEMDVLSKIDEEDSNSKQILVERNLRLVVYIAKKFENTGIDLEDLISIGTIGLMKAINTFNTGKNIKLATYASRCIENEILMYLRRNNKIKGELSIDEPLNQDRDGNELLLSDVLGTDEDIIYKNLEEEVDHKLLKIAISKLTDKEKYIMNLRFGMEGHKEKTQKEVADMLGISQSYISRLEKKIMLKMRKEISSKVG